MWTDKFLLLIGIYFQIILTTAHTADLKSSLLKYYMGVDKCNEANHEVFGMVKSHPDNCERPPKIIGQTIGPGCRCADGYVFESATNKKCVLASECKCPPNQEWIFFDPNFQVPRCNKKENHPKFDAANRGCTCKAGYALTEELKCVLQKNCKK